MKISKSAIVAPICLIGGLLAGVVPASADFVVTFSTTGAFSGGTGAGTNVFFTGSSAPNVTYLGLSDIACLSNPASANCDAIYQTTLGQFTSTTPNGSSLSASGQFTVTIDQTLYPYIGYPCCSGSGSGTVGTTSFSGTLSQAGSGPASGSMIITWNSPPTVIIQGISYTLDNLNGPGPNQSTIGPNQTVTLSALISAPAGTTTFNNGTPEPAFYGLVGIGLFGLGAIAMRRKRKQSV